ncbi:MAG: type II toxin-antitoxin system PemK/MazF family toxin [Patescibacteria group bacterium]|nr:type II toxin-antitoxin system PemK/MazF family toxin [Patescibacteria group bacterium]
MQKDFDGWNERKKVLENRRRGILFKEGEIWWCSVGINIGEESCGKGGIFRRPILVIKKLSEANCIGIPISTKIKIGTWFTDIVIKGQIQTVLLYQIRMFSVKRFQRRLTVLDSAEFSRIKEKLEALLELSHNHQSIGSGSVGDPKNSDNDSNLVYNVNMFSRENLHHAYFIEGERAAVLADIDAFMQDAFGIVRQGHPDVHFAEYESLGIDESRGLQDMQSMRPVQGDRKIFILAADSITSEAQNSLLKVFEEPTPGTHFFIVSSSERILLPTLRSRLVVLSHPSARKNDAQKSAESEARKFIPMSPKARLEFVAHMIEEKDKAKAEEFLQAVIAELARGGGAKKNAAALKELLALARYLKDRAPSVKLILERVALLRYE